MPLSANERTARYRTRQKTSRLAGPSAQCQCGCGTDIPAINSMGQPAMYAHGHSLIAPGKITRFIAGQTPWNAGTAKPKKRLTPEELSAQRREEAAARRDYTGANNPFHGKKHSEETKKKMSQKKVGSNHPGWNGGTATAPYGPEFTRAFKRLIRQRDGHRCQRCGAKRRMENHELEVHHIDHDKLNNDPVNLITVCGSCNVYLSYHREESLTAFPLRKMLLD